MTPVLLCLPLVFAVVAGIVGIVSNRFSYNNNLYCTLRLYQPTVRFERSRNRTKSTNFIGSKMDLGGENLDFIKLINVKGNIENITPHKIAVVAFIREYGLLKIEGKYLFVCVGIIIFIIYLFHRKLKIIYQFRISPTLSSLILFHVGSSPCF